jgi:hypothetical protein
MHTGCTPPAGSSTLASGTPPPARARVTTVIVRSDLITAPHGFRLKPVAMLRVYPACLLTRGRRDVHFHSGPLQPETLRDASGAARLGDAPHHVVIVRHERFAAAFGKAVAARAQLFLHAHANLPCIPTRPRQQRSSAAAGADATHLVARVATWYNTLRRGADQVVLRPHPGERRHGAIVRDTFGRDTCATLRAKAAGWNCHPR